MTRYRFDQWELDSGRQTLYQNRTPVQTEYRLVQLLLLLLEQAGQPVSKDVIMARVWPGKVVGEDTLYVSINQLRKLLGDQARMARYIKTVPGRGYSFIAPVNTSNGKPGRWLIPATAALAIIFVVLFGAWFPLPQNTPGSVEPPAQVSDDYRRARYLLAQAEDYRDEAAVLLQQVIESAPDYGPARAELANLYLYQYEATGDRSDSDLETIRTLLRDALALAPESKITQMVAGHVSFWVDWDLAEAERYYRASLGSAEGHHAYAQLLLARGEFDRAHQQVLQYQLLNPQGYSQPAVAWIANMSGDSPAALRELDALADLPSPGWGYHQSLQATHELLGNHDQAYQHLAWLMRERGYSEAALSEVERHYRSGGLPRVYHWLAFVDTEQREIGQYRPPLSLARYAIKAGEPEQGLLWLQHALARRQTPLLWLAVDPAYAPLRGHPEFHRLLDKIGAAPPIKNS